MDRTLGVLALVTLLGAVSVARAETPAAPAPPPVELRKTVEAFSGKWAYDANVTMPDGKAMKMELTMDCRKTALGKAVACTGTGNIPGQGAIEGSFLVGYDTFGRNVHFMAMTSDEEVHDHKCSWKGNTLGCEPLKAGSGGKPVTEDLSISFEGKTSVFTSVQTFTDGSKVSFRGTATRAKK